MPSILDGVGEIIDAALGLKGCEIGKAPHYRHRESCLKLSRKPLRTFDGKALFKAIYEKIECNWDKASDHKRSRENWRFEPQTKISAKNKSPEVKLERAIVEKPYKWVNQVPVASGLVGARSDKRRAIDLAHQCEDGSYEFIELKVASDTPLYAAMEILQYGVLYIFARRNERIKDAVRENRLLEATTIHLRVLAPCNYYKGCKLDWLEDGICEGLKGFLAKQKVNLRMDFRFEAFPPSFSLNPFPEAHAVVQALSDRRVVFLRAPH